ncbi:MAG: ATP-binding protein [Candidatus Magasanikbacteria bacterium]|nr:ATP-binding protein [Candidatus Magasanikbacteria bacterium]
MYVHRTIEQNILNSLNKGKIAVLYGARRVGKTTLLKNLFNQPKQKITFLNCDESRVQDRLVADSLALTQLIGESGTVIFDEMQYLTNPGHILKIIADYLPNIRAVATGSSTFDLSNKISEPLTGRHEQFTLYPFSFSEIDSASEPIDLAAKIQTNLIFGSYPTVFNSVTQDEKIQTIVQLTENYLYKDILSFDLVKNSHKIRELLLAIALQTGQEVSYHELSQRIGFNYKTVERYIDLLEKSFVLFRLPAFSRNRRNEISRKVKIYFYDCGIRNSLINNFNPLHLRADAGALWENYLVSEVVKKESLGARHFNLYFWRTHTQQEIDLIMEKDGKISAYEIKLSKPKRLPRPPSSFTESYPNSSYEIISLDDFQSIKKLLSK